MADAAGGAPRAAGAGPSPAAAGPAGAPQPAAAAASPRTSPPSDTPTGTSRPSTLTASLSRVARTSMDVASLRTRSLARASLRAIGLEHLADGGLGGHTPRGDRGLGAADRRVLKVQLNEWRDDAELRASLGDPHHHHHAADGKGEGGGGGGGGGGGHDDNYPAPAARKARCCPPPSSSPALRTLALAYGAIGIVFGDVLTSPLYTLSATFAKNEPTPDEVAGAVSIIIWTLALLLVTKYALIVLRADDGGQGGTFALYALLRRQGAAAGKDRETAGLGPGVYTRAPVSVRGLPPPPGGGGGGSGGAGLARLSTAHRRRPTLDRASAPVGGSAKAASASSSARPQLPTVPDNAAAAPPGPPPPPPKAPAAATGRWWIRTPCLPTPGDAEAGRASGATAPAPPPGAAAPATAQPPAADWRQCLIESPRLQAALRILVAVAVGAILGDGVLTPAISVVSSMEGLSTAFPSLPKDGSAVLGAACAVLVLLFFCQQFGTGAVSAAFSPIGCAWIMTLFGLGGWNLAQHGSSQLAAALSPHHIFRVFKEDGAAAWRSLGSLALCITGAEALYADLGHFSRPSIQAATLLVAPALAVNYLGQGALLMARPEVHANVFWSSVPKTAFWPVFVVSTLATIVASQALISASFSVVAQAIRARFVPRLRIVHTSREHEGQIYIPAINWMLATLALGVVGGFRSSDAIGNAYGLAVLTDMLLSTAFCSLVMLTVWRAPVPVVALFYVSFTTIEAAYWSATLLKVPHGGWYPIMMAALFASIELVWHWGTARRAGALARMAPPLDTLLAAHSGPDDPLTSLTVRGPSLSLLAPAGAKRISRTRGVALYLTDVPSKEGEDRAPPVLAHALARLPVLYEANTFLTVRTVPVPEVPPASRFLVASAGVPGFAHVIARYGYMERPKLDGGFANTLLSWILDLLYSQLAATARTEPGLRAALALPADWEEVAAAAAGLRAVLSRAVSRTLSARQAAAAALSSTTLSSSPPPTLAPVSEPHALDTAGAADPALLASLTARADALLAEIAVIEHARSQAAVVFVVGDSQPRTPFGTNILKRALLCVPYTFLVSTFQEPASDAFGIEGRDLLGLVLPYDL